MHIRNRLYICKISKSLLVLLLFFATFFWGSGQMPDTIQNTDTIASFPLFSENDSLVPIILSTDSVVTELLADTTENIPKKSNQLDAKIEYSSQDSIVFWSNGTGFLHGAGDVKYRDITLKADYIRVKMDSSVLYARGTTDSIGDIIGEPIFGEGDSEYNSKEMVYNLKTKKGYVFSAVTQQGEAYIVSERTKKTADDMLVVGGTKVTTCDRHDCPCFYLHVEKGKMKPNEHIVFGPANLVVADVPLPIFLPFGFFPFTDQYSSGLLMPSYTDELTRGLGLTNGGYYFAINDYVDMEMRGEIYTKGTWGISTASSYIRRYKFSGSVNLNYREDVVGEKDMPDYQKAKSLSLAWSHRQDAKANPYRTLSASVNFSTSGYNRNNINSYYNPAVNSQNTKSSSITFTQRFPNVSVLSLSGGMQVTQRTSDSTINMSLPNLSVALSRIYPLKRKNSIGKERWYEKISMSYSGTLANSIQTKEDQLLNSSLIRDWRNGMRHSVPVSASFNLFNYITITPSISYNERWHTSSFRRHWDDASNTVVTDTIYGFNRNYDFNGSVSAQTKLYGYYIPSRKLFGDKVDRIRHVVTPSIGLSYRPDFGDPMWGAYDTYIEPDPLGAYPGYKEVSYSKYQGTLYGGPSSGKSGSMNFSVANNLEMKIRNDNDTTAKEAYKKVTLIDNFSLSSSYNMLVDSMNLSNINANLRLKFGSKTINLSGTFDPYMYKLRDDGVTPYRSADYTWSHGMFPHFLGTSSSYTMSLNNDTFKKLAERFNKEKNPQEGGGEAASEASADGESSESQSSDVDRRVKKKERADLDLDGYEKVNIPWNVNVSYSVNYRPSGSLDDFNYEKMRYKMKLTHSLQLSANMSLTSNWNFSGNTSYDFEAKQFTQMNVNVTRNLHCWTMTANFVPFGRYKSYNFRIGVNASMLADLKYEKQNRYNSNPIVWY